MVDLDEIEEVWVEIPDFPNYAVSNLGMVMNVRTEKLVKPQLTPQGIVYVPLWSPDNQTTKSIKVLVAKAFVEGETDVFDTPINKDGNKSNNRFDNLVWRPRWFAVKYSRQFLNEYVRETDGPVYEDKTNEQYANVREAAIANGLLFRDIYRSAFSHTPVFPTWQEFRIPNPIHVR